jgi:hypothetical protein
MTAGDQHDDDTTRQQDYADRRKSPRSKKVLLSGVIVDLAGRNAHDCQIRDLSADGAQIALPQELALDSEQYLLDTRNRAAHRVKVVWTNSGRCGLSFINSYDLRTTLPAELGFLDRVLLEAKMRQILKLIRQGMPAKEARTLVGLDGDQLTLF